MNVVKQSGDVVNVCLEMRLFKGSDCPLAPEYKYDYVCSIEILRIAIP